MGQCPYAALTFYESLPSCLDSAAQWRHHAQPCQPELSKLKLQKGERGRERERVPVTTTLRERRGGGGSKKDENMRRLKSLRQAGDAIAFFKAPTMAMAFSVRLFFTTVVL